VWSDLAIRFRSNPNDHNWPFGTAPVHGVGSALARLFATPVSANEIELQSNRPGNATVATANALNQLLFVHRSSSSCKRSSRKRRAQRYGYAASEPCCVSPGIC
jgi:hypothetical protein